MPTYIPFIQKALLFSWLLPYSIFAQFRGLPLPSELKEISGLASLHDQQLWGLNDGGNAPILYQIDPKTGVIIETSAPGVNNVDWEELCTDNIGRFWIADIGNNLNNRQNLRFYRFDPASGQVDSLLFSFPDQVAFPPKREADWNFDTEAVVWKNDTLHLFTKSRFRGRHFTKHYQLPAQPGNHQAQLVDSLYLPKRAVTGAALSHDGQELVLIAYYFKRKPLPYTRATLYHFSNFENNRFLKGEKRTKRLPKWFFARQFESVVYFKESWWVANEQLLWQRPRLWKLRF